MKINRTVQRSLRVLEYVANSPKGLRLSELVEALNIPKSSLFDIISTLTAMNFLREHDKRFFVGIKTKEVGDRYGKLQDLCDVAEPILSAATEKYNTSTCLVRFVRNDLEYLCQYHPKDAVMVARQSSPYNTLHASATGKVLLSALDPKHCEELVETITWHKFTDRTLDCKEDLLAEVEHVRQHGYALDNREYHYLLQCVAAPITFKNKIIAAMSFSGLNLYNESPDLMINHVKQTARDVSEAYARA